MPKGVPRVRETRETERRTDSWVPPSVLPEPEPREGFVFRWVRASTMGAADPTNMSKRFREGWVPVRAEDHPEVMVPSDPTSNYCVSGNIEVGGLVLCSMPKEQHDKMAAYYTARAKAQERATSMNYLRGEDPRMPLINQRRREVQFGRRDSADTSEE